MQLQNSGEGRDEKLIFNFMWPYVLMYSRPSVMWASRMRPLRFSGLDNDCSIRVFCKIACFIKVFEWSYVYKCMGFSYLNFLII